MEFLGAILAGLVGVWAAGLVAPFAGSVASSMMQAEQMRKEAEAAKRLTALANRPK